MERNLDVRFISTDLIKHFHPSGVPQKWHGSVAVEVLVWHVKPSFWCANILRCLFCSFLIVNIFYWNKMSLTMINSQKKLEIQQGKNRDKRKKKNGYAVSCIPVSKISVYKFSSLLELLHPGCSCKHWLCGVIWRWHSRQTR